MKKFIIKLFVCVGVGTLITFGTLKFIDSYLYKITQSSYLEADTYRTSGEVELKDEDVISIPEEATQLQFSYNNKYYAYLEDGKLHINTIEDRKEYEVITEDNPICYYYMLYDKNLIMYFIKDTTGSRTTLTLRTYEIATI